MEPADIRHSIQQRYARVAARPEGQFPYPVGRESIERLGYDMDLVSELGEEAIRRYVGVGNPFSLGMPGAGWCVADIGCGAGVDSWLAARCVGPHGRIVGIDMSSPMLQLARCGPGRRPANICFVEGCAESLPIATGWADLVISNGVLNLAADKPAAMREIARVLKPGGRFQAADLIRIRDLPARLRNDGHAWSS